ncbi:type IV secretory system conjugative DNA transfer family protein [Planctomycetota bacterium]
MRTLEQALVAQAGPYMVGARAKAIMACEVSKGCEALILPQPVALEPTFCPIDVPRDIEIVPKLPEIVYESVPALEELVRLQVWISPEQEFNWDRCEMFLKQLRTVSHRVGLEIAGNQKGIFINLLCHRQDIPVVTTSFDGKIEKCKLSLLQNGLLSDVDLPWADIKFRDYSSSPPYFHLLTQPEELHDSSYESLVSGLAKIPSSSLGICQVLFQPVSPDHKWHDNVKIMTDFEYTAKLLSNVDFVQRYGQQVPSGNLINMAGHVETKAHNDKPFFSTALRIGVLGGDDSEPHLRSLAVFSNLFQHGGRSLRYITEADYVKILSPSQIHQMFLLGLTYRPGFLLNSCELASLVHVPPLSIFDQSDIEFDKLEPLASLNYKLSEGTPIGTCNIAGRKHTVCIPDDIRLCHTHLIGKPRQGKSTLEEHMIMDDIKKGHGVAVLDPHGDMVDRILSLLPEEAIPRVVYFEPGNFDWVPLWNPLERIPGQDIGRMADDLIGVLKSVVEGWGDRMENILRHSFFGLLHLSGGSFLDVCDVLRYGSKESEEISKLVLKVIQNELARQYWKYDLKKYKADEFGPPRNKLSKLLVSGTISLMLSQPHSAFNFRRIMDDGMIFLANLSSNIGTEVKKILGGFMVAIIHMTALGRSEIARERRRPFHMYLDEGYLFVTDSIEDIITNTPKYGVSLTIAHHYMRQFKTPQKMDALGSVGTKIVFNVDARDGKYLCKDFQKKVRVEDFLELGVGDAIVCCGTEITKIKTLKPLEVPEKNFREQIIAHSRAKYCKPAVEVREIIKHRHKRSDQEFSPLASQLDETKEGKTFKKRNYGRL